MTGLPVAHGSGVSRETSDRLDRYQNLLLRWTERINLIAPSTRASIATRHIADSLQLWPHAPAEARSWVDLGSGGGLPGLVIAIIAAEQRPGLTVTLVESDQRKAVFLRHAAAELGLPARVVARRIESLPPMPQDVISARALAPLPRLLELSRPFLHSGTVLLFPKGRSAHSELTEARRHWHIEVEAVPSRTDRQGVLLRISRVGSRS